MPLTTFDSPIGPLFLRARSGQLVTLSFHAFPAEAPVETNPANREILDRTKLQLEEYFAQQRTRFELALDLHGSELYRRVWQGLIEIPYGRTTSYGELAERVGVPGQARAVGAANGANPIAIIVPCHRVIGADGSLVGYGGGLWRKQKLLDLESKRLSLAL